MRRRFPHWAEFMRAEFGSLLRAARVTTPSKATPGRGMSQEELAELLGVAGSSVSRWEGGKVDEPPPRDVVMRIEAILEVDDYSLLLAAGYHPLPYADLTVEQRNRLSSFVRALFAESPPSAD